MKPRELKSSLKILSEMREGTAEGSEQRAEIDHLVRLLHKEPEAIEKARGKLYEGHVYISSSLADRELAAALQRALESQGVRIWSTASAGAGDPLWEEIEEAIAQASHLIVLISAAALNSTSLQRELELGLTRAAAATEATTFKVIPILLPPMEPASLKFLFPDGEPVALRFEPESDQIDELMPELRVALGLALAAATAPVAPVALAELIVEINALTIDERGGERHAQGTAELVFRSPGVGSREVRSRKFRLRAPLGSIEAGELTWYLERFATWPSVRFKERAEAVEAQLKNWGRLLFEQIDRSNGPEVWAAFDALAQQAGDRGERCLSILVDPDPPKGCGEEEAAVIAEAATLMLSLPWELVHDGESFLAEGRRGMRVRRRMPNRKVIAPLLTSVPVRVLVVSPRPEDDSAGYGYIDHRISARPLTQALASLGGRVELEFLHTPTRSGLSDALAKAGRPFHVVHFDGHGTYSRKHGLGALCFEHPEDQGKLEGRRSELVSADELAGMMRDHRVPLVFLEACQPARSDADPTASVAGRLLRGGVASVVAMSHSVLVETAKRFVEVFYGELSAGATVGASVLAAQRRLREEPGRGRSFFGQLELQDWFVPVLFQEEIDPQLVRELPGEAVAEEIARMAEKAVEALPREPEHGFVGRSRELLKVERLLVRQRFAVLVGEGGEGKTTLASELARWLVLTRRFEKAGFVSLEKVFDARGVLSVLGGQLVPGFEGGDDEQGWQQVERRLRDRPTLLVFDNMESVLPDASGVFEPKVLDDIFDLAQRCSKVGKTRVVFTSRSKLPSPFAKNVVRIGRFHAKEAQELVALVLGRTGDVPAHDADEGEDDVSVLVRSAGCHARSLVLLAGEVKRAGVRRTAADFGEMMASMAERFPDDRERSLFASVELSLRRLPAGMREKLRRIGVFQGGGHLEVIAPVLKIANPQEAIALGKLLEDVGLAEQMPYGHLRLHPALGPLLLRELSAAEQEEARGVWVEAMTQLVSYLYEQRSKNAQLAAGLTLLELPNLLKALDALRAVADAEGLVDVATSLEGLLQNLGRPKALARVVEVREKASQRLGGWSHARFEAGRSAIDRLLDAGRVSEAAQKSQALLDRARAAEESAYGGASYDLAMACFTRGSALKELGAAAAALSPLQEAQQRFTSLVAAGSANAERMASVCLTETGDCLTDLGRLGEAAQAYEEAIELAEALGNRRQVAVGTLQLGTVRKLQGRHGDALAAFVKAREIFEAHGEPGSVAVAWHQIGNVHIEARRFDVAEHAYQQSLAIMVQLGNRPGEASSLGQLGNLYSGMGRVEDAIRFYRDAATVYVEIGDSKTEGMARSNLAYKLVNLQRYDEARQEIVRAIECKKPFGHTAEPWKTFTILRNLEHAVGNAAAAVKARRQAIEAFLAYRRDGGDNLHGTQTPQLCEAVHAAIQADQTDAVSAQLSEMAAQELPEDLRPVVVILQEILAGARDRAVVADPALGYHHAAEILLLLDRLT